MKNTLFYNVPLCFLDTASLSGLLSRVRISISSSVHNSSTKPECTDIALDLTTPFCLLENHYLKLSTFVDTGGD
jgi:hypothetical protein